MTSRGFCLGAATALASVYLYTRAANHRKYGEAPSESSSSRNTAPTRPTGITTAKTTPSSQTTQLLDTPDLDLRLIRKAEAVILGRTDKVVVVVERCTNDHNYSAILRTVEALGIQTVYIVDPPKETVVQEDGTVAVVVSSEDLSKDDTAIDATTKPSASTAKLTDSEKKAHAAHRLFAQNATEWLTIREFPTTGACLAALKQDGFKVWVTDLSQEAVTLTADNVCSDIPDKVAIVMGTEAVGCSQEMLKGADLRVYLPLWGFADSLNLSVATALVIQQVFFLIPQYAGSMEEGKRRELRQAWFSKLARQRLMSSRDKKKRKNLQSLIYRCEQMKEKGDLTVEQQAKIAKMPSHMAELKALEDRANFSAASQAVADLVDHPPQPLTDLRRADVHRVTFVGKKTKKQNAENWKDMVATTNAESEFMSTAAYFRERVGAKSNSDATQASDKQ